MCVHCQTGRSTRQCIRRSHWFLPRATKSDVVGGWYMAPRKVGGEGVLLSLNVPKHPT